MGLVLSDIEPSLQAQGAGSVKEVKRAELGPDGSLAVDLEPDARPRTRRDLDEALAALRDQLRADGGGKA